MHGFDTLSHGGETKAVYLECMVPFTISLEPVLACPRRFYLEKVRRERHLAPFAASVLGKAVHRRISDSLRSGEPAVEGPFPLPRRILLQAEEELEDLVWRAHSALAYFNVKCRAWLQDKPVSRVEHYILRPYRLQEDTLQVSGVLDLILTSPEGEALIDWKTGSAAWSETQLKFYLTLRYRETGSAPRRAEAVSLSGGKPLCVPWTDELPTWFEGKLEDMRDKLSRCHTREAVPGPQCTYCLYAHTCEVGEAPRRRLLDRESGEIWTIDQASTYG